MTVEQRITDFVTANMIATHAYQVALFRKHGRGDPSCWMADGVSDAELQRLVAHQQALLSEPPDAVRAWADGHAGSFDPSRDMRPLCASPLRASSPKLPVHVLRAYFACQPGTTALQAQALAGVLQMMLDIDRDGDLLHRLFAHYVRLGLPVHTGQIGIAARTDEEFLALARMLTPEFATAPFDTDDLTLRMMFRKLWTWGHRHTGERNARTVAQELLQEPDVQRLLPRLRAIPPQRIAQIGHSFSMEVHWQSPSAFVPFVREILASVNPSVAIRQWTAGGLSLSRPVAEQYYQDALEWKPNRVLFVVALHKDKDYVALERMTSGFRAAGVKEVAVFDHLRPTQENTMYEESEKQMRAVAQRAGLTIIKARARLDASPDVANFAALDGIHMAEPYHRTMATIWLEFLADSMTTGRA